MLAILVSLALLIVLTFRKINIVVVGIAAAAVMPQTVGASAWGDGVPIEK